MLAQSAKPPYSGLLEIASISARLEKCLRTVGEARATRRITIEEVFIFLALGYLGISHSGGRLAVRPVTIIEVAALLNVPRETVRRKASNLADMKLVTMKTRGVMIDDLDTWRFLAEAVVL